MVEEAGSEEETSPSLDLDAAAVHRQARSGGDPLLDRADTIAAIQPGFYKLRTEIPASQSQKVALMNLALLRNDRAAAEALAEEIQGSSTPAADPWWSYWQGQYRLHTVALERLREMAR